MKDLCVALTGLVLVTNNIIARDINTQLRDWNLDSVILTGNSIATMYFSKEIRITNPNVKIKVVLPSNAFFQPEAWAIPTLPALTVETLNEPISPGKVQGSSRYEKWQDSLETLKDTLRRLKIKLETVERGLDLLEENWELPENADALDETLDMWLAYHLVASESLLVRKTYLETAIQKLEEQVKSIESFLKRRQPALKTRKVLVIKPYSNKAGTYKIIIRVYTRAFSLTPLMNIYVKTKAGIDTPEVKVDWIIKVSQNTGIDWKNTTIVYYPEAVEPQQSKVRKSPYKYLVISAEAYRVYRPLFRRRRGKLYAPRFGGEVQIPAEETTSKFTLAKESIGAPEISIEESKLLPTILRIRNATILDGSVRSFNVISKFVHNATIDLYAFSGSDLAVYTLTLHRKQIEPIIAHSVSLFYNGNLMGKRNLSVEDMSETIIRIPLISHPLVRVKTQKVEEVEKNSLLRRTKTVRFSVVVSSTAPDTLTLTYSTLLNLKSKMLNYSIKGMEAFPAHKTTKGTETYIDWKITIPPSQTINLTYEFIFSTKRKYEIVVSTYYKDAF